MVARRLADHLKVELVRTDDLIEARTGKSVNGIFEDHGESYFREIESEVVKEISHRLGVVIDCGGGVVCTKENLQYLKSNGIVFYLQASPEVIYQRIKNETHRPLLKVPDPLGFIRQLYQQRLPLYNQADYIIDANDASIEGPVVEILRVIASKAKQSF